MAMNIMYGLGKESPIKYTEKYGNNIDIRIKSKLVAEVKSNHVTINMNRCF